MYNILSSSEWRCILGKWCLVVTESPCYSKFDSELLQGLVMAVLVSIKDRNDHVCWTGYIPPRTKNHLPLVRDLEEAKQNAIDFIHRRDGILRCLTKNDAEDIPSQVIPTVKLPSKLTRVLERK